MGKMIEIDNCFQCKYRGVKDMRGNIMAFCLKKYIVIEAPIFVPSWCPLPDAPEAEKLKEALIDSLKRSEKTIEKLRDACKIDPSELDKPMDI